MFNRGFRPNIMANLPNQESFIDIENNTGNIDIDVMQNQMQNFNAPMMAPHMNMPTTPIMEPVRERVIHRHIEHVVPHVCPVRTRIINHHIYKHTYQPNHTCVEENTCQQVQCGSCCNH